MADTTTPQTPAAAPAEKPALPLLNTEVASILVDPFETLFEGVLRTADVTLLEKGGPQSDAIYLDLLRDPRVFADMQTRDLTIVQHAWHLECDDDSAVGKAAVDACTNALHRVAFDAFTVEAAVARIGGLSVHEIVWHVNDDGFIAPARLIQRARRRFVYVKDDPNQPPQLRLITRNAMTRGEPLPERKFIAHRHKPVDDNPYGIGLGQQLYWPVFFKRQGIKFWLRLADRFGSPTVWGKHPSGATQKQKDTLLAGLRALRSDGAIITPEGTAIELIESALSGNVSTHHDLCDFMDAYISAVILGREPPSKGGGALAAAAIERGNALYALAKADADLFSETLNTSLIRWMCEYNGWPPMRLYREVEQPKDTAQEAKTDQTLDQIGWRLTEEAVTEKYGEGYERKPEPPPPPPPSLPAPGKAPALPTDPTAAANPAFAQAQLPPDQLALDAALKALDPAKLQAASEQMTLAFRQAIGNATSFESALVALEAALPKADTTLLQGLLAEAMFGAQAFGRASAQAET